MSGYEHIIFWVQRIYEVLKIYGATGPRVVFPYKKGRKLIDILYKIAVIFYS